MMQGKQLKAKIVDPKISQRKQAHNPKYLCQQFLKKLKLKLYKINTQPKYEIISIFEDPIESYFVIRKLVVIWESENGQNSIWLQYQYDQNTKILNFTTYSTKNNKLINIEGNYNIIFMTKLFQKYTKQSSIKKQYLQYIINPLTGRIKLIYQFFLSPDRFLELMEYYKFTEDIANVLQYMLKINIQLFKFYDYFQGTSKQLPRHLSTYKFSRADKLQSQKPDNTLSSKILKLINISINNVQPNFNQRMKNFLNQNEIDSPLKKSHSHTLQLITNIMKWYQKIQTSYKQLFFEQLKLQNINVSQFLEMFLQNQSSEIRQEEDELCKKITILTEPNKIKWLPLAYGGFGFLEKAYVQYQLQKIDGTNINNNYKIYKGYIVRKSDLKSSKIAHQYKIFNILKNQSHPNIQPYYFTMQKQKSKYIYSKFSPNMSLDRYIKANKKSFSLETATKLLQDIVKGLLFLKKKQIVHLDIKLNNIIITQNLTAKITDFGQAFYQKQDALTHHFGITVPYSPQQVFYTEPHLNNKVDVYAMGVTMFKVLFGYHLWGDILDEVQFKKSLIEKQPTLRLAPQKLYHQGIPEIIGVLVNLSLKCINRQQFLRPSLLYVAAILALCKSYLKSLFYDINI